MGIKHSLTQAIVARPWIARPLKSMLRSRWFTHLPLYQRYVLKKAAAVDARIATARPTTVIIETILTCNARCLMCLHSQQDMRGEMSMELFAKIVRELADWGIPSVVLTLYGEPFADRHLLPRIEMLRAAGINYRLVSNGSLLKQPMLERMIELGGWEQIIFSVNGFSTQAYEAMMPPLKRDAVYANIDAFLQTRARMNAAAPLVKISCVVTSVNFHEQDEFKKFWLARPGISEVLLADCGTWMGELKDDNLTVDGARHLIPDGSWLAPCPSVWEGMVVLHDGRVIPCCEDAGTRRLVVGDVNGNTLSEIFHGPELTALRQLHKANRRCDHGICGQCRLNQPWTQ